MANSSGSIFEPFYNLPSKFKFLTPKRFDFLIWMFIIWVCLLTDDERFGIVNSVIKFSVPFKFQIDFPTNYKFIIAVIFAGIANVSLDFYVRSYLGIFKEIDIVHTKELLDNISNKAGIKQIYHSKRGVPAICQPYSSEVMKKLADSRTIKLLSIAGYEYIGKGEGKSLFYDVIRERHYVNAELILLNPTNDETISERISQLKRQDQSYTNDQLKNEILETTKKVKVLEKTRNDESIKLYYCKFHPIFRLIILDDCLFMNTYEMDYHGHESPVYKIDKLQPDNITDCLSLYNSFYNLFDNIKKHSDRVI